MPVSGPARGVLCGWRGALSCGALAFVFFVGPAQAQDVAEAARQERARKAAQQKPAQHVYTEEDLKHDKILIPEDQARVQARRKQQGTAPAEQNAQSLHENPTSQQESLGEIARRYRREKASREAEQVQKKNFAPFPYQLPDASMAAPKMEPARPSGIAPAVNSREKKTAKSVPVPHIPENGNGTRARISPFQPRPLVSAPPMIHVVPVNPPTVPASRETPVASAAARSARPVPAARENVPKAAGLQPLQVQRGDSWWRLSERFLGSGARWRELRGMNPEGGGPPDLLRAGSVVQVPIERRVRAFAPGPGITVKKGDSLWSIARAQFGRGAAWACLARVNPQVSDYKKMAVGTVLVMPASEAMSGCLADPSSRYSQK